MTTVTGDYVRENSQAGIIAYYNVLVSDNDVYNNVNGWGIELGAATATGNYVHDNADGIYAIQYYDSTISGLNWAARTTPALALRFITGRKSRATTFTVTRWESRAITIITMFRAITAPSPITRSTTTPTRRSYSQRQRFLTETPSTRSSATRSCWNTTRRRTCRSRTTSSGAQGGYDINVSPDSARSVSPATITTST